MGRIVHNRIQQTTEDSAVTYRNVSEALVANGLDWGVVKRPLFARIPNPNDADHGVFRRANGLWAVTREDTNHTLGVVSARYQQITNAQGFALADTLKDATGLRLVGAGELDGGAKVWLQARTPEDLNIGGEPVVPFILFIMAHDGTGTFRVLSCPVRFFCTNQMNGIMRGADFRVSIRHTQSAANRIEEAREVLSRVYSAQKRFVQTAEALLARAFSAAEMRDLANKLLPEPDRADPQTTTRQVNAWSQRMDMLMRDAYCARDLDNVRGTAWGALSAVADFEQHLVRTKGTEDQKLETLFRRSFLAGESSLVHKATALIAR